MNGQTGVALVLCLVLASTVFAAAPPLWESSLGSELTGFSDLDDGAQAVALSFLFPYAGTSYGTLYVGTNGAVALGALGKAYDYPSGDEFQTTTAPIIAPFWSDLSIVNIGRVMFNDFGDRAVITWDGVGTFEAPSTPFTFQLQMRGDGTIIFGYLWIPGVSDSVFNTNVHVGLTEGNLPAMPSQVNYTAAPLSCGSTVLEVFPVNGTFDLRQSNLVFTPQTGGYAVTREVTPPPPPPPRWESSLGSELTGFSDVDDGAQSVALSFQFPYAGTSYGTLYVGTNGAVALGALGKAYDYPSGDEFQTTTAPMIAPFWSDMDLEQIGRVTFNDFGDRAVITWDGVGTYQSPDMPFTFQLQLLSTGEILLSYHGIPGVTADVISTDVFVGLTEGNLSAMPAEVDYTGAPFFSPDTVLEVFELGSEFDLDGFTLDFVPQAGGGYLVQVLPEPATLALLALGACGVLLRRRK